MVKTISLYDGSIFEGAVTRETVRGIVLLDDKVLLMRYAKHDFYSLPGGGMAPFETPEEAFYREIKEETGYECQILTKCLVIEEYRQENHYHQLTHCFIAKVTGQGETQLDDGEKSDGLKTLAFHLFQVMEKIVTQETRTMQQVFLKERDRLIITEAIDYLYPFRLKIDYQYQSSS